MDSGKERWFQEEGNGRYLFRARYRCVYEIDQNTKLRVEASGVAAPDATRRNVINPGRSDSRPTAMKRNDAPQIPAMARNRPQSAGVNAFVASGATGRGAGIAAATPEY